LLLDTLVTFVTYLHAYADLYKLFIGLAPHCGMRTGPF